MGRRASALVVLTALFIGVVTPSAAQFAVPKPRAMTPDKIFGQQCGACHSTVAGQSRIGPSLAGIVGRRAGTVPGFAYSAALRRSRITWNAATLDRWLANSAAQVPGTSMTYAQADAAKRQAIVSYLATLTPR